MIFNGVDLTQYFRIKNIRKSVLPPVYTFPKVIPGKPGAIIADTRLDMLHISVDIRIRAESKEDLNNAIRELAGILFTKEPKKLILPDDSGRYYMAQIDRNTDLYELHARADAELWFICPDPLAYGNTKTIDLTGSPTILNEGTHETTGVITVEITEDVSNLNVTLQNTGEFVYVSHDLVVGDTILIDLEKEMIYKNSYSIMHDCYLESDFFDIPTGESQISVSSGNATLKFTERWL